MCIRDRDIAKEKCKSKEVLSHEASFKIVLKTLESHRQITIELLQSFSQPETKADHSKPSERKYNSHNVKLNDDHGCSDSFQCWTGEWDLLGCIELYSIENIDERIAFMKSKRIFFKCGSNYRYTVKNVLHTTVTLLLLYVEPMLIQSTRLGNWKIGCPEIEWSLLPIPQLLNPQELNLKLKLKSFPDDYDQEGRCSALDMLSRGSLNADVVVRISLHPVDENQLFKFDEK